MADIMGPQPLSMLLEDGNTPCPLDGKQFVPLDHLETVINKQNVKTELGITDGGWANLFGLIKPSNLPDKVTEQAKKVFAALVLMGKASTADIQSLLNEGLADRHLPLSFDRKTKVIESSDGATTFRFSRWMGQNPVWVSEFVRTKQWLFLAPILDTTGQLIELNADCPLPFTESDPVASGAAGIVHRATVHHAHQRGFEEECVDLQVAVKEFRQITDFDKENGTLQEIKDLQDSHIIRHFASIRKGKKKGYIIFPWANDGNLQEFWEAEKVTLDLECALWSMRQMSGLATALHSLHKKFNCRHGDLKPVNILCIKERGEIVLKIADFGVSRIHQVPTMYRNGLTISHALTPSYQGPEVEFESADKENQRARSRKYDIWSLGCVFLEFSIWLLHGSKAIADFAVARGTGMPNSSGSLYEVTDRAAKVARVHRLVSWTIKKLEDDPRCEGKTGLAALLSLVKDQMLQPKVDDRPWAEDISNQLKEIVQEAEERPTSLFHSSEGLQIPPLDFTKFQPVPYQDGRT